MDVLVLGGTRYFGKHMVRSLLNDGHSVTVATRGIAGSEFGDRIKQIILERTSPESISAALSGKYYDVICDNLAYCSNDIKCLLDSVRCGRYVMTSSTAVYDKHMDTREEEFDPSAYPLRWIRRSEATYSDGKRQAECALFQGYPLQNAVAVRYPFVVGEDDYTKRLYYYVEHIVNGTPMHIDNIDCEMGFIHSSEAGSFLAWMAGQRYAGVINGCSDGTISLRAVIDYAERKTGKKAIYSHGGEAAPYNGEPSYSINTDIAAGLGHRFTPLNSWIYSLLDIFISEALG